MDDLLGDDINGEDEETHEPGPPTSQVSVVAGTEEDYALSESLEEPDVVVYRIHELYDYMISGTIDLSADYQRDDVWTEDRRVKLIDSIYRNFYVPPVIFCEWHLLRLRNRTPLKLVPAISKNEDGTKTWTCMDGKQRLTSIKIITRKELFYTYKSDGRRNKKLLPRRLKELFSQKSLYCVGYHNLDFAQEQEYFQRVQMGMPLSFAEILNVNFSPRAALARELEKKAFPHDKGIAEATHIPINTARGKGFQNMVQALCVLSRWEEPDVDIPGLFGNNPQGSWLKQTETREYTAKAKGKSNADGVKVEEEDEDISEVLREEKPVAVREAFREKAIAAVDVIVKMAENPRYAHVFSKHQFSATVAPVVMVGWILLVFHAPEIPQDRLADLFLLMRARLHHDHTGEVKNNTRCGETVVKFVTDAVKDWAALIRKAEECGLFSWAKISRGENGQLCVSTGVGGRKRKRNDEENENATQASSKKKGRPQKALALTPPIPPQTPPTVPAPAPAISTPVPVASVAAASIPPNSQQQSHPPSLSQHPPTIHLQKPPSPHTQTSANSSRPQFKHLSQTHLLQPQQHEAIASSTNTQLHPSLHPQSQQREIAPKPAPTSRITLQETPQPAMAQSQPASSAISSANGLPRTDPSPSISSQPTSSYPSAQQIVSLLAPLPNLASRMHPKTLAGLLWGCETGRSVIPSDNLKALQRAVAADPLALVAYLDLKRSARQDSNPSGPVQGPSSSNVHLQSSQDTVSHRPNPVIRPRPQTNTVVGTATAPIDVDALSAAIPLQQQSSSSAPVHNYQPYQQQHRMTFSTQGAVPSLAVPSLQSIMASGTTAQRISPQAATQWQNRQLVSNGQPVPYPRASQAGRPETTRLPLSGALHRQMIPPQHPPVSPPLQQPYLSSSSNAPTMQPRESVQQQTLQRAPDIPEVPKEEEAFIPWTIPD
ncbi:hypothetical protein VNI00_006478 [Paramarasmius palmivorus]|uniref:GmrSD restriction endonucleases N-terminal domain-containing protein n=1 Tax=Paramarasmius palmivorus TaxID=297713 RepID=A0AAW0D7H5_9AGAR